LFNSCTSEQTLPQSKTKQIFLTLGPTPSLKKTIRKPIAKLADLFGVSHDLEKPAAKPAATQSNPEKAFRAMQSAFQQQLA
jgi:hypothetical protein